MNLNGAAVNYEVYNFRDYPPPPRCARSISLRFNAPGAYKRRARSPRSACCNARDLGRADDIFLAGANIEGTGGYIVDIYIYIYILHIRVNKISSQIRDG